MQNSEIPGQRAAAWLAASDAKRKQHPCAAEGGLAGRDHQVQETRLRSNRPRPGHNAATNSELSLLCSPDFTQERLAALAKETQAAFLEGPPLLYGCSHAESRELCKDMSCAMLNAMVLAMDGSPPSWNLYCQDMLSASSHKMGSARQLE